MAYETGVVASASALKTAIETFAVAQGWTLGGGILSKGACYVRLTTPSAAELRIEGGRGGTFSGTDLCPRYSRIKNTTWPASATYHLASFANPDTIWCTIHFDAVKFQHLGFGMLAKYGTWTGGMWFHGQHNALLADGNVCSVVDGGALTSIYGVWGDCALFWQPNTNYNSSYAEAHCSSLHCEIRGYVWEPPVSIAETLWCPGILSPTHRTNPNVFNGQTLLSPFQLFTRATDSYYQPLGHVGHLRFVKLTNYNPGDVLTLGDERWKVYPWYIKDVAYPHGSSAQFGGPNSTGVLGVAVRYDGP